MELDKVLDKARKLTGTGKSEEAIDLLSRFESKNPLIMCELASIYFFENNDLDKANELIENAFSLIDQRDLTQLINYLIIKAEIEINSGHLNLGLDDSNKIIDLSSPIKNEEEKAIGEYLIALGNYQKGNLHIALEFSKVSSDSLQQFQTKFNYYLVKSIVLYAQCLKNFGKIKQSEKFLKEAEHLAKTSYFNLNLLAQILNLLGELKLSIGEYKEAERYLKSGESLTLYNQKLKELHNKSLADLGELYFLQGDVKRAVELLNSTLSEQNSSETSSEVIYSLRTLGKIYRRTGDLEKARNYFERANNILAKNQSYHPIYTFILIDYARTLLLLNNPQSIDEAFELILKVKSFLAVQGLDVHPKLLKTEGLYYVAKNELQLAKQIYSKALNLAIKHFSYFDVIDCHLSLAEINLELYKRDISENGFFQEAKDHITQSLNLSVKQNMIPTIIKIRIVSSVIHASERNYGLALQELQLARNKAEQKNLGKDLEDITRIESKIQSQLPEQPESNNITSIISLISRFTSSSTLPKLLRSDIILMVYKLGEKGPTPYFYSENNLISLQQLKTIGVMLISVTGQGHTYFSGLFGPIPIREVPNHLALCYTGPIKDENQKDERLKNTNYILIATIFPQFVDDYIMFNRKSIQSVLNSFTTTHQNLTEWDEPELNLLYDKIINCFDLGEE